jgi:hypothetical protein
MLVLKGMSDERPPETFARVLDDLERAGVRCPQLLGAVREHGGWVALLSHLPGRPVSVSATCWAALWQQAFSLLTRLAGMPGGRAPWDLRTTWLRRLEGRLDAWPVASRLLELLATAPPQGGPVLAHGDFAPQNFLDCGGDLALVDWDEMGCAEPGFDGGWLLALNRVGAGPRMQPARLRGRLIAHGAPEDNLVWFEGLGLLRLLYRASTLPLEPAHAHHLIRRIEGALSAFLEEGRGPARRRAVHVIQC